jgi:hypothetical protein
MRTKDLGESLQKFDTAVKQLSHHAYLALPKNHIRREAGKVFSDRVEDPTIKLQLLLGGEKSVKEALRQALELQAILLAARPKKRAPGHSGEDSCPKLGEENKHTLPPDYPKDS